MTSSHTVSSSMPFEVQFVDVGRNKRAWSTLLAQKPTALVLERLVRKHGALMSSDIECVFDDDGEHGTVYAGIRPVGAFHVKTLRTDEDVSK